MQGDEILIHYIGPDQPNVESISIEGNTFSRTVKEDTESSLIFFENKQERFKFVFTNNKININTEGAPVYLFNCNTDDKFSISVSDNFITSSNKENILSPNFQKNPDAMMDFDFDKDFQSTPSIPADQITSESSCSVFTFDNPDQEIINNRCSHSGKSDDNTVLINILRSKFDGFNQQESGGAVHITNCGMKSKGTTYKNCEATLGCGGAIYVKNTVHLSNNVDLDSVSFISINLQIVDENKGKSESKFWDFISNNLMVVASVLAVFAVLAVVVVFAVLRSPKKQKLDSSDKDEVINTSLEISEVTN